VIKINVMQFDDEYQVKSLEDKPEESCGVFGIHSQNQDLNAAELIYLGLYALQHRGQESAGMVLSDGRRMRAHKDMGLVSKVFSPDTLHHLQGRIGIGHVRYSTTGSSYLANAQPLMGRSSKGILAMAHNGNLVNTKMLQTQLEEEGSVFQTSTDTEVIMNLIAQYSKENLEGAVVKAVEQLRGSYSLLIMSSDTLIGIRDPYGFRPLCLGKLEDSYIISSESCVFSTLGAKFIQDLDPGEMVIINNEGYKIKKIGTPVSKALCIFEYIYFARPDSIIDGLNVHLTRKKMGQELAKEFSHPADVVIPVPNTGFSTALGFSEASGIPYDIGLIKNTYIGRTFIQPQQELRDFSVRIKLNPVEPVIKDRRVVIIDDTIVRGTTSGKIISLLRESGASEVHMCVSAPPITHSCYYGIDTSVRKELIASNHSIAEIQDYLGVDSLTYLSLDGLKRAVGDSGHCLACFNGDYPILSDEKKVNSLEEV